MLQVKELQPWGEGGCPAFCEVADWRASSAGLHAPLAPAVLTSQTH